MIIKNLIAKLKKIIFESEKIYKLGKSIKDKYEKIKISHNYISYNDIIKRSIDLLGDVEYASWVMYKMDGLLIIF